MQPLQLQFFTGKSFYEEWKEGDGLINFEKQCNQVQYMICESIQGVIYVVLMTLG